MKNTKTAALSLALVTLGQTSAARADETRPWNTTERENPVEISLQLSGGGVFAPNAPDFSASALGAAAAGFTWRANNSVRVGFRTKLGFTSIPYGNYDGEPYPFKRSELNPGSFVWAPTAIITTTFWLKIPIHPRFGLDASLGSGRLASAKLGALSILPAPSAALGAEIVLGRSASSATILRLELDTLTMAFFEPHPIILMPNLGLAFAF